MEYLYQYESPLGRMTFCSDGSRLTGLWFDGQRYFCAGRQAEYAEKDLPVFAETKRWLELYFNGQIPDFTPPLRMQATPFRRRVWEILLTIPYGETMTYGEIAGIIAQEQGKTMMSAQAVGGAVGHNPISIIVPCHRVIGSGGKLTGYAGGVERKEKLLKLERENKK